MMPKKARTKRNEKIRKLAAEGYTRQQIARIVNMHPNSVASILRSYIVREELMEVPNSNPRVYYDPHVRAMGDVGAKTDENDGSVENIAVLVERGFSDTLPRGGLPNGWVNMHISGIAVSMKIRKKGTFDDVPAPGEGYCGYWDKPKAAGKGMTLHHCHLPYIFRQRKVGAVFRIGSKGGCTFTVNPGRVYFDPRKISQHQAKQMLLDRAVFIASLLSKNGWQLTDPEIKGRIHIGKENDPLAEYIPSGVHDERKDITTDFSPARMVCETELEHPRNDQEIIDYSDLPTAVAEVREGNRRNSEEIELMKAELIGLKEVIHTQGEVILDLTGNVTRLTQAVTELTTLQTMMVADRFPKFTGEGYQ